MPTKPEKPNPDFPLFPHKSGQWAKKIKGSVRYFGVWADPESALILYESERKAWEAGINPRTLTLVTNFAEGGMSLGDGLNFYLEQFKARVDSGKVSLRSYKDNVASAKLALEAVNRNLPIDSMQPAQWLAIEMRCQKGNNATTYGNHINRIRCMMKWLVDNRLIKSPYYGTAMKRPSKTQKRIARNQAGMQWFDRDEIKLLLKHASPAFKAMILLGVNCGYGNADCARLQTTWLNLETGWINFPRPKTGIDRKAKLWPESIDAVKAWLEVRPRFKVPQLFITRFGNVWSEEDSTNCQLAKSFRWLCKDAGIHEIGRGFYGLRRTTETIGGEAKDQVAVDYIMGHIDQSMAGVYRQRISDQRVADVCNYIRDWLYESGARGLT